MKFQWTGCCFRVEFELFPSKMEIRRYRVAPTAQLFGAKRQILRQLSRKLKAQAAALSNESAG